MPSERYEGSRRLFERATRVIPGGSHLSGRHLVASDRTPSYFERGLGAHVWDVDGNEYVDYILGYGPFLLGYARPEIDRAALDQIAKGSLLSLNHPMHVRFAEALVARFPSAEMAAFFKSGSEATTAALRIARRATGRRKIARAGYHGWHDWCLPLADFVPEGLDEQILEFDASDPATLEAVVAEHDLAAVIVAPEMVLPLRKETLARIARIAKRAGAVFVLDEVKTALRTPPGSIQERFALDPDLTTLSKALGNGWPVAAVIGKRDVMRAAEGMHLSATYHGHTAAMAAALAVLSFLAEHDVADHVTRLGERLVDGLNEIAKDAGAPAEAYGEPLPCMPFFRFVHDDPAARQDATDAFFSALCDRGVLMHPRHMGFLCWAHTDEDVDRTLDAASVAMRAAMRV